MDKRFTALVFVFAPLVACGETSINPTGEKEIGGTTDERDH